MNEKDFDPGKLIDPVQVTDGYYFLIQGTAPHDGSTHAVLTRGRGKDNAGTRIPVKIRFRKKAHFQRIVEMARKGQLLTEIIEALIGLGYSVQDFDFLYVVMPRHGNAVSGVEVNAPGGTSDPGETREEVARREFGEEGKGLLALAVGNVSGMKWAQYSSGCYREVQYVDIALVVGEFEKLTEGAVRSGSVNLQKFPHWLVDQNNPDNPSKWETETFTPVDGKVALNLLLFISQLRLQMVKRLL